jgi:hypothetical protein
VVNRHKSMTKRVIGRKKPTWRPRGNRGDLPQVVGRGSKAMDEPEAARISARPERVQESPAGERILITGVEYREALGVRTRRLMMSNTSSGKRRGSGGCRALPGRTRGQRPPRVHLPRVEPVVVDGDVTVPAGPFDAYDDGPSAASGT